MYRFHIELPDDLWEKFKTRAIQEHGSPRQAALFLFRSFTDRASQTTEAPADQPCDHPEIVKEERMGMGQWSGDWVCTSCGAIGPKSYLRPTDKAPK